MPKNRDETEMAMFGHLASFLGLVVPFGSILGPLAIYIFRKDNSEYIKVHAAEAFNFQLTCYLFSFLALLISIVMVIADIEDMSPATFVVPVLLFVALFLYNLTFTIIAAIRANRGGAHRYPATLRLLK